MPRSVGLLRAVNVGGRKLPMADLRACVEDAGFTDVVTYIQSGNVVFTHKARSGAQLESDLEACIQKATKLTVEVMVRSAKEMQATLAGNPFADTSHVHVAFAKAKPEPFDATRFAPEELVVTGRELYLYLPNGMGVAKLPVALKRIKTPITARNWNTVTKLADLAAG